MRKKTTPMDSSGHRLNDINNFKICFHYRKKSKWIGGNCSNIAQALPFAKYDSETNERYGNPESNRTKS